MSWATGGTSDRDRTLTELQNLLARFNREQDPAIVLSDQATDLARTLSRVPGDDLSTDFYVLHALGWLHWHRFRHQPESRDQDLELETASTMLDPVHRVDPSAVPADWLPVLGYDLHTRFQRTGALEDLDRAITVNEQSVVATPPSHRVWATALANLGNDLRTRFDRTRQQADLDRAVEALEQAVQGAPPDHPNRASFLSNLGIALRTRYELTRQQADLDRLIEVSDLAVSATPLDGPDRAEPLTELGVALLRRYTRAGVLSDLDRGVEALGEVVAVTPTDHSLWAVSGSNLGAALLSRYARTGIPGDLDQAIELFSKAVSTTPDGDPEWAGQLTNLGAALKTRFQQSGDLSDLDRSVEVNEQAVAATPSEHPELAGRLHNVGAALLARYEQAGQLADLDRAISICVQAVEATESDHPELAMYLSNLAGALHSRFERTGRRADLDRAIDSSEQAVAAATPGHPMRAGFLSNLNGALQDRFNQTGQMVDLDRAIEVGEQAVAAAELGHPERAMYLSNLGLALLSRFKLASLESDLNRAVDCTEQAVSATPPNHPNRATHFSNFGLALFTRFLAGKQPDLERAVAAFREAARASTGPPLGRARAARAWGRAAGEARDWPAAVQAYETGVALLGQVAPRRLARADQEHQLAQPAGIGSDAAAACLQAADHDPSDGDTLRARAVELFEQGRAVLFAQALDTRTDLTDLTEAHPDLAARFTTLVTVLDQPTNAGITELPGVDPQAALAADTRRRRDADEELGGLIDRIRGLDGFAGFLQPAPAAQLLAASADGPVVLLNNTEVRGDALILRGGQVEVVPLSGLTPDAVVDQVNTLLNALHTAQLPTADAAELLAGEQAVAGVLGWLWDEVTGPVLDHLGLTRTPPDGQRWPRVYWCPSGLLAFLPLHAAGHHPLPGAPRPAVPATVMDRVVSSTIPTVRALQHARRAAAPPAWGAGRLLVVAMPHTPGQHDLPGAVKEADFLTDLLPDQVDILGLPHRPTATHHNVLDALPTHPRVHFACHGAADLVDPSTSHLLLTDYLEQPLTVLDLARTRLNDPTLAFLSACTTGRPGADLPDEPIHLAAACQLAGYQHVIATLWPIRDTDATLITKTFYRTLATTDPSTALHTATHALRANYPTQPTRWAAHTHAGP